MQHAKRIQLKLLAVKYKYLIYHDVDPDLIYAIEQAINYAIYECVIDNMRLATYFQTLNKIIDDRVKAIVGKNVTPVIRKLVSELKTLKLSE